LNVTSATLTMFPLFRSSLARWAPMNPPPPVTSMRLIARPFTILRNASYMQSYGSRAIRITLPFPPRPGRKLQTIRGQSLDTPSYRLRGALGAAGRLRTQFSTGPDLALYLQYGRKLHHEPAYNSYSSLHASRHVEVGSLQRPAFDAGMRLL